MLHDHPVELLSEAEAKVELNRLADALGRANNAYHQDDNPEISDADYDALKRRYIAIEARFPHLKQADSPSDQVGAAPTEGFGKIRHAVRMLSLSNAFSDEDITDFDTRIRRYLGLSTDAPLAYTAEPKIDGLSCSLLYENGVLVRAATVAGILVADLGARVVQPRPILAGHRAVVFAHAPAHIRIYRHIEIFD